ncbi:hypothetical protein MMC13_007708 [Lambiella insularis]|nr:hypothetical protein [Lambiella insularis]
MALPIPQPPGIPLLGVIFDVDPSNTWVSLKRLADKYGPIFKIKALGTQIVFIGSAALLEEICDETRFRKCVTGPIVEIRAATHDVFTAYDSEPSWGIAHSIMAPLLTASSVEATFTEMRDAAAELVSKWARADSPIDVIGDLKRSNLEAVMRCLFDQPLSCLEGPVPPVITAMDGATNEAMKRPTRPRLQHRTPPLR